MIDRDRAIETFLDLIRINSPSKHERGVADYVKAKLEALGFDVEEDDAGAKISGDAGNVIAFKKGCAPGARGLLLSCHMDTVEPTDKLNIVIDGDEIRTDGTTILGSDDKGGIAAVLEGVRSILERDVAHGDLNIVFSVSEEVGLLGARSVDASKIRAELGYVFDTHGSAPGITVSAPHHENIIVEIYGKAAHAGIEPENGVSAIVAASSAISKMKLGRIDEETTANVGVIEGGKARNVVPDHVIVKAEARSRNEAKLDVQVEHMKNLFEEEAAKIGAKADFRHEREYVGFRLTQEDDVVKLAMAASRKIGVEPTFHDGGGGSDANVFNGAGLPTANISVGMDGPHSLSERIAKSDIVKCAEFVAALVEEAGKGI